MTNQTLLFEVVDKYKYKPIGQSDNTKLATHRSLLCLGHVHVHI